MSWLILMALIMSCLSLAGCQSSSSSGYYSQPENPQCRAARANYQMCYGSCLTRTPGGVLTAMGICGNECIQHSYQVNLMCAK